MGLSSGKKTKTSSSGTATVGPNPAYADDIQGAKNAVVSAYPVAEFQNRGLLDRVGDVNAFNKSIMQGSYLNDSPWLQGQIDASARDIRDQVGSVFESGGRYGSGKHAGVLSRALADMENDYRFKNYSAERAYQDAAGGKILQGTTIAAALPQLASSTYADALAQLLGRYTTGTEKGTSTSKESGGLLGQLLAAGAQVGSAALMASDPRLKREIQKIGELADGLGVYVWRYLWGTLAVGVMADEVAEKRPWALGPVLHGFATVNYGAL